MNLPRRNFLQFAAGAAIPLPRLALAEDAYASRPIHVIVGFTPGASADVAARGRWTEVAHLAGLGT